MVRLDMSFTPENIMPLAMLEEAVDSIIQEARWKYPDGISQDNLWRLLERHGIDDEDLPPYLVSRLDEIAVC